jgi:hypothetical protein
VAAIGRVRTGEGDRVAVQLARWTMVWAAGLLAAFVVWSTLTSTADLATPLPYLDQWDLVREIEDADGGIPAADVWWSQHDEHRPVVPRLFLYADFWFFGGQNISDYVEIFVFHSILVAIVGVAAWRLLRHRDDWAFTGALCLSVIIALGFSMVQVENFIHAFQVLAMLGFMAAVASFAAVVAARGKPARKAAPFVLLAIVFAGISQFSFANGVLAWPVLAVLAWWLRLRWPFVVGVALAGVVLAGMHYADYTAIPGRSPADAAEHPIRLVIFFFRVMGSPFIPVLGEEWSTVLGIGAIASFLALLGRDLRRPREATPSAAVVLYGLMLFTILTAAAISVGRSPLGLFWAEAPRYAQGPVLFWGALFTMGWLALEPYARPFAWQAAGISGALALTVIPALTPDDALPPWRALFGSFDQVEDSLYTGVLDRDVLARVFPYERTAELAPLIALLDEDNFSVFAGGNDDNFVGQPLDEVMPERSDRCVGFFDVTQPVKNVGQPGSLVAGWAWDPLRAERPARIVIVDSGGTIVGQARSVNTRTDVRIALAIPTDQVGWDGYARATEAPARAWAFLGDGTACLLPGEHAIPSDVLAVP